MTASFACALAHTGLQARLFSSVGMVGERLDLINAHTSGVSVYLSPLKMNS